MEDRFIDWLDKTSIVGVKILGLAVPIYLLLHTFIF
jgi:hypothetical protein